VAKILTKAQNLYKDGKAHQNPECLPDRIEFLDPDFYRKYACKQMVTDCSAFYASMGIQESREMILG